MLHTKNGNNWPYSFQEEETCKIVYARRTTHDAQMHDARRRTKTEISDLKKRVLDVGKRNSSKNLKCSHSICKLQYSYNMIVHAHDSTNNEIRITANLYYVLLFRYIIWWQPANNFGFCILKIDYYSVCFLKVLFCDKLYQINV